MIRITVYADDSQSYTGFDTEGHAGYAEDGQDIVCAAASILIINTLNAIEAFTDEETSCISDEEAGMIRFRFLSRPGHDAKLLMDTMILGLQNMEESDSYESYIDIIFKEV